MKKSIIFCLVCLCNKAFTQNVGIGTTTPTRARLVVTGVAGNAQAIFGDGLDGISLETGAPLIGFNNYYLDGRKFMANGYAGSIAMSSGTGNFSITTYGTGTAGSGVPVFTNLITILQNGNVGIGNVNPTFDLDVTGTLRTTSKATFNTTVQIAGGAPTANKVLTATDALGNAIWANAIPVNNNTGFRENVTSSTIIAANGGIATVPFTNTTASNNFFDDGPNINNTTNAYVAPMDGVYQFNLIVGLTAGTVSGSGGIALSVLVNGFSANVPSFNTSLSTGDAIPTPLRFGSFLLKLAAGDAVSSRISNNTGANITIPIGLNTQFSGVRIY